MHPGLRPDHPAFDRHGLCQLIWGLNLACMVGITSISIRCCGESTHSHFLLPLQRLSLSPSFFLSIFFFLRDAWDTALGNLREPGFPALKNPASEHNKGLFSPLLSLGQVQVSVLGSLGHWELAYTHINILAQKMSQVNSQASKQKQWICAGSLSWVRKREQCP